MDAGIPGIRGVRGAAGLSAWGLPRLSLGTFPAPIEPCPGLLPPSTELWVMREDLAGGPAGPSSGPARGYGGSKVRKLELVLADPRLRVGQDQDRDQDRGASGPGGAQDAGPATILTLGGYGSHHVLATALYAIPRGHRVAAVLAPQPITNWSRKTLKALLASGATLYFARRDLEVPLLAMRARRQLPRPLIELGAGGSSPLGNLAWVLAGREIAAQVQAGRCPRFDAVYVALGSGGMAAGLWLGLGDAASELVAVNAVRWSFAAGLLVRWLAARARARLPRSGSAEPQLPRVRPSLRFDSSQLGPGYGHPTKEALEAVRRAAGAGLKTEPVYTGKVLAAILRDAGAGRLRNKRVLFVHSASSVDPPMTAMAVTEALAAGRSASPCPDWLRARLDEPEGAGG